MRAKEFHVLTSDTDSVLNSVSKFLINLKAHWFGLCESSVLRECPCAPVCKLCMASLPVPPPPYNKALRKRQKDDYLDTKWKKGLTSTGFLVRNHIFTIGLGMTGPWPNSG